MSLTSGSTAVPPGPLLGREAELAMICGLFGDPDNRLVTLTGPPGVGKTRLALAAGAAVAGQFPDGVVFVDLTAVRDPELVTSEIVAALARDAGSLDAGHLPQALHGQRLLLVVDNFEHVLPAATMVVELLAEAPDLRLLVTSRERLHLRAERELPVPPLALPGPADLADPGRLAVSPAVALLLQRIRAFDPGFALTPANSQAVAEICVRLDGLPLALELAAPRLRLFNPAELLFRLRHRVGSLAADARDIPDRHRTLSAALAWSHDLLGPEERAVFRQLSVFVGGWTLEAAHRVCAVEDPVAAIASLVDKSLVRRAPGAGSTARFGMLESLREFATEQLDRTGEREATRARHAAYFSDLGTGIESRVGTGDERAAIEDVGLDVGNLREAVAYHVAAGRPQDALPVSVALGWYSYTRGQLGDGQRSLDAAITAAAGLPETSDEALAGALVMVGAIALGRGDVDTAEARLERGLAVNERVGSVRLRAIGTAFLGHVARTRGRTADAVRRYEEAGRLHGQLANVPGVAWSRYDLGLLARRRHEPDRAADLLRESLCAFRELHYEWAISCSAWALATVELSRGQIREAADLLEEALAAALATDDFRGVAQCFEGAAGVAAAHGAPADAARLLGAADSVRERLAAPLPVDEQGAVGAVRRRVRHSRGNAMADDERAGRALSTAAALALARDVLGRPARNDVPKSAAPAAVPPAPAGPAAQTLTPREAEVADLVRRGCTNRQIARRLGITEKTAEVHVHHIIGKLGAGNRAEVAAWVAARDAVRP